MGPTCPGLFTPMQKPTQEIPLAQLEPSPTNPRKHFDPEKLKELAASIARNVAEKVGRNGLWQPLLVRPVWCQGCKTAAQIEDRRTRAEGAKNPAFEIVDGERRQRAFKLLEADPVRRAALAQGETPVSVPCDVCELTDTQVVEIQLITYIQKEALTLLEEANGFAQLTKLKAEDGSPLHTPATIAARLGCKEDYVHVRIKLLRLPPVAMTAVAEKRIGIEIARAIARIPHPEDRVKAAAAIVQPARLGGETMTTREATLFISENFMHELKGAPFDTADAKLDEKAGSCAACPNRTGNNPELFGDVQRGDICTLPLCYRQKCKLAFERASAAALAGDRDVAAVVAGEQAAEYFSPHDGVSLPAESQFVDFSKKPPESFVSSAVDYAKLPTWERLCDGLAVKKTIVQDREGRMRVLVPRDLAIAAAIENGEEIFVSGIGAKRPAANAEESKAKKAEAAAQKRDLAVAVACSAAVRIAMLKSSGQLVDGDCTMLAVPQEIVEPVLDLVLEAAGPTGAWWLLETLRVKKPVDLTTEQTLRKALERVKAPNERFAIAVELLYARQLRLGGVKSCAPFLALAKGLAVDLKAVEAATVAEMKPPVRQAQGAAAAAAGTNDPKRLAEWVKARAKGMSDEKIAASYRVPVADVTGALGVAGPVVARSTRKARSARGAKGAAGGKKK